MSTVPKEEQMPRRDWGEVALVVMAIALVCIFLFGIDITSS
jgi:hypothetical protein